MSDITGIILAAGKGTRMKSRLPKALHKLCGKAMTRYIVDACKDSGVSNCIVVIGHGADQVREGLGDDVLYTIQDEQLGTGDACRRAMPLLEDAEGTVLVTPGDTPLLTGDILRQLIGAHESTGADATVLTTVLENAGSYGRLIRNADGSVARIVEAKDTTPEERSVGEINAAIYCFKLPLLRKYLGRINNNNAQGEYYLTDVIGLMVADGLKVGAVISPDSDIVEGINDRVQLAYLTGRIRERILKKLMLAGVTLIDPASTYVDADAVIGQDTVIYPNTFIEGKCTIGEGCTVGPSARLVNVSLGNEVTVLMSNLTDSTVDDGTRIGPFAHLRPGCKIGKKVKLGDFVEAKNATLEDRVSMGHLAYIGDAVVGEHTNIGAGVITCNYDGYKKHRTVIGRNVFLGSDVTIVAPVSIGDGSLIAAGSVVTDEVPADSLAVARSRQTVKDNWAKERRDQIERGG